MNGTYIRPARPRDFDHISNAGVPSMLNDPLVSAYFGCNTPESVRSYISFTLHSSWQVGGVIDMVCMSSKDEENDDDEGETIVAIAIWLPPRKRITSWSLYTLLRSGILSLTQAVGAQSIMRMSWEYPDIAERSWNLGHFCFLDGPTWSHDASWHLKLAFTAPSYQKKGMMTRIIRERLTKLPESFFALETTSLKAQKYFRQFDFEIMNRSKLGVGHVDGSGKEKSGGCGLEVSFLLKRSVENNELWEKTI